jgi:hypothetical protein
MSYGHLNEKTASLWVAYQPSTQGVNRWPSDGQGGYSTTESGSLVASASSSHPVIIEAVEVQSCANGPATVTINNANGATTLFTIKVPTNVGTQWFAMGGAYGVRVNQNFCVNIDDYTKLTGVKVYFRWE